MGDLSSPDEALLQFLYAAPIGLVQMRMDGTVEMLNPMSATLLMPVSRNGDLDNLFEVLNEIAPQLRGLAAAFEQPSGMIGEGIRIQLDARPDGHGAPVVLSINLAKLRESRLIATISDVTLAVQREQRELAQRLSAAARTDQYSQMPNRRAVHEVIQQALDADPIGSGTSFAVLYAHLDRLDRANDRLQRAVADEIFGLVAARVRSSLRQWSQTNHPSGGGGLAACTGSDEFVLFLDGLEESHDVALIAQWFVDALDRPYIGATLPVHFSASIGVTLNGAGTNDADVVLQRAHIAMMEARQAGGACFILFDPGMHERAVVLGRVEDDLRRAITDRELFVVYQPVVQLRQDSGGHRRFGVEALVRWRHPTRGVILPGEFIGIAEECGLIDAIGEFVLKTACRQFVAWEHAFGARAPRTLAVNVSRAQLGRDAFIDTVRDCVRSTGIAFERLQLEVTESLAAQDEAIQVRLRALKNLGLRLALDDFGTGFSSLASLHLLPVDTVKIDRSFVSHGDASRHHHVLIQATVLVANSLGMITVAEGIETDTQATAVRELGCDHAQGNFFSSPLPASELVKWLELADDASSSWP